MVHVDFLVGHQGTKFGANQDDRAKLIKQALSFKPVMCGFTEMGQEDDRLTAKAATAEMGYTFVSSKTANVAIAVSPRVTNLRFGETFVHGGKSNPHGFMPRVIVWARGFIDGNPELDFTFHEFHSVTLAGRPAERTPFRIDMAETVSESVVESSTGDRIAIAAYDLNEADGPEVRGVQQEIFEENGLRTLWDELGRYPDTFDSRAKRAIDGMVRLRSDERIQFVDADVTDVKLSDHHRLMVTVRAEVPDVVTKKSIRRIAREVIAGKWGNGDERRARLTEAGYDYDLVQAKVAQLLAPPVVEEPPAPIETEHPCLACGNVHMGVLKETSR